VSRHNAAMPDMPKPRRLAEDPDARSVRWGWVLFAAWTLVGGTLTLREFQAGQHGALAVVLLAPFWAAWCMWLAWRTWVRVVPWLGYQAHQRYQGNYYEFDGRQVRIWFAVTELWIAVDDVLDALGYEGEARDVARIRAVAGDDAVLRIEGLRPWVFTEAGLRLWLARRGGDIANRLDRWFEIQVVAPFRKRRLLDEQAQQRHEDTQSP
jgi:hypothetical protein